jgi:Tfp pilus assembly protein PilE
MRARKLGTESGVTLIEFMIGIGILTMIAYAATHFFSRLTQSDAEVSAKAKAQSELALLNNLLEKDMKFRDIKNLSELCTASLCTQITLERLASSGGTYTVSYTSSCQPTPANSQLSGLRFQNVPGQCIKALNCPLGTHPSLAIRVAPNGAGGPGPAYPAVTPALGARRAAYNLVGAALCASKTRTQNMTTPTPHIVSQDRIILEGAFLGSNNVVRVERKETVISSNNMARIQMLPN